MTNPSQVLPIGLPQDIVFSSLFVPPTRISEKIPPINISRLKSWSPPPPPPSLTKEGVGRKLCTRLFKSLPLCHSFKVLYILIFTTLKEENDPPLQEYSIITRRN